MSGGSRLTGEWNEIGAIDALISMQAKVPEEGRSRRSANKSIGGQILGARGEIRDAEMERAAPRLP